MNGPEPVGVVRCEILTLVAKPRVRPQLAHRLFQVIDDAPGELEALGRDVLAEVEQICLGAGREDIAAHLAQTEAMPELPEYGLAITELAALGLIDAKLDLPTNLVDHGIALTLAAL